MASLKLPTVLPGDLMTSEWMEWDGVGQGAGCSVTQQRCLIQVGCQHLGSFDVVVPKDQSRREAPGLMSAQAPCPAWGGLYGPWPGVWGRGTGPNPPHTC